MSVETNKNTIRVMLDTNVLLSALLFPSQRMNTLIERIVSKYQLVLSSFIIEEFMEVICLKFPDKESVVDFLLQQLPYEYVVTPQFPKPGLFSIRDETDYPVLYSAIVDDVDVFVSGDKDFTGLGLKKPDVVTPAEFLEKYK
jgi:putative PIN family toxin of toxin-antitoxin system